MKHESRSDWKQLGSLANGVLRAVAEKRMKQAEFLAAEKGLFEAASQSPYAEARAQLDLPLSPQGAPLAQVLAGRH